MTDYVKATAAQKFTSLSITTDGTVEGTKILLNGEAVQNLSELNLSFNNSSYWKRIGFCMVTTDPESKPGTLSERTTWCLVPPDPSAKAEASLRRASADEAGQWQGAAIVDVKDSPYNRL